MRHTATVVSVEIHFSLVHPNGMGVPDVIANPVNRLHICHRFVTEFCQAEVILIFGFCQVGVQVHLIFSCQNGGIAH